MSNPNTVTYAALAVILLVVLGASFYSFSQIGTLNAKVTELQNQNAASNAALLNALTARVTNLENQLAQVKVNGNVLLFYDSSCTFCNNKFMLDNIEQTRQILANYSIGLKTIDVKDNPNAALAVGVRNVPVFFAGASDLATNAKLVDFMNTLPRIQFSVQESTNGLTAYPPTTAKVIQNTTCAAPGKVNVEEFYSPTCPFCRPVSYANGTRYNPSTNPKFASLSGESAQNVKTLLGDKMNLTARCINVHSVSDNEAVLNVTASDEGLCLTQVGTTAYDAAQSLSDAYGISGAPTFVLDCQYITKVRDTNQLKQAICDLHPELCSSFPAPTLPPEILDQLNKTANASG